jgi:ParB family chromosome partitioning protein
MKKEKSVLGRGLSALIADADKIKSATVSEIRIEEIEVNPFQPRTEFDEEAIKQLSESIKQYGLIQPITVRKIDENHYQLISGERRLRAAKLLELETIPAYIREANDQQMLEMALVENIHRKDLDPIEIAISYKRLIEECNITQEELSNKIGKDRTTISNFLRLLKLPEEIQIGLKQNKITVGHARALINIDDTETQKMIYKQILLHDFSVREVEDIVRKIKSENTTKNTATIRHYIRTKELKDIKDKLSNKLGCKVDIRKTTIGSGKIIIHFDNEVEFNKLIDNITKE